MTHKLNHAPHMCPTLGVDAFRWNAAISLYKLRPTIVRAIPDGGLVPWLSKTTRSALFRSKTRCSHRSEKYCRTRVSPDLVTIRHIWKASLSHPIEVNALFVTRTASTKSTKIIPLPNPVTPHPSESNSAVSGPREIFVFPFQLILLRFLQISPKFTS